MNDTFSRSWKMLVLDHLGKIHSCLVQEFADGNFAGSHGVASFTDDSPAGLLLA
jgi:hypothetical protein